MKAVLFCPHTEGGTLAKNLRKAEEDLEKLTGYRMKVVEKGGDRILDLLQTSDPWRGEDCGRAGCWPCRTKMWTEKDKKQDCSRRSVIYETWCQTCLTREEEKIEEENEMEKKRLLEKIPRFKYLGESARSSYERGAEHLDGLEKLSQDNHLVKHIALHHQKDALENIKFGMRVRKMMRTAFERQIGESVEIQRERNHHHLMNSRSEYNRCSIPRLTAKLGDQDCDRERLEEMREEREEMENVMKEIARRRKEKCKERSDQLHPPEMQERENQVHKRRKLGEEKYVRVLQPPGRKEEKTEEIARKEPKPKKRKVLPTLETGETPPVFYGEEMRGLEPWNIDWNQRLKEKEEQLEKEEKERRRRKEKAKRMEESWALWRECKRILQDDITPGQIEREEIKKKAEEKEERLAKARKRKEEFGVRMRQQERMWWR